MGRGTKRSQSHAGRPLLVILLFSSRFYQKKNSVKRLRNRIDKRLEKRLDKRSGNTFAYVKYGEDGPGGQCTLVSESEEKEQK
jgi:hypothetical protein